MLHMFLSIYHRSPCCLGYPKKTFDSMDGDLPFSSFPASPDPRCPKQYPIHMTRCLPESQTSPHCDNKSTGHPTVVTQQLNTGMIVACSLFNYVFLASIMRKL